MKLIEKQKCLDMVKEILHAMGKIAFDEDNEYHDYLLKGYYLTCDNVWQRFKEIDDNEAKISLYAEKMIDENTGETIYY